jgi:uncharacterized membrane protein YesL
MIARWFTSLRVFVVWLLGFSLALIIMALGHELMMTFLANTLHTGRYMVRLVYVVYYTIAGLVCVAYYILIHEVLSISAHKGRLLKTSLLIIGIQVLLIGLIQLGLVLYGYLSMQSLNILIIVIEGLVGAVMLFLALRRKNQSA